MRSARTWDDMSGPSGKVPGKTDDISQTRFPALHLLWDTGEASYHTQGRMVKGPLATSLFTHCPCPQECTLKAPGSYFLR